MRYKSVLICLSESTGPWSAYKTEQNGNLHWMCIFRVPTLIIISHTTVRNLCPYKRTQCMSWTIENTNFSKCTGKAVILVRGRSHLNPYEMKVNHGIHCMSEITWDFNVMLNSFQWNMNFWCVYTENNCWKRLCFILVHLFYQNRQHFDTHFCLFRMVQHLYLEHPRMETWNA